MDRQKINKLLVDVINEDAVNFKNYLSEILYQKVNRRLQEEYKNISKNLFEMDSTNLSKGSSTSGLGQVNSMPYNQDTGAGVPFDYNSEVAMSSTKKEVGTPPPPPAWWPGFDIDWDSLTDEQKEQMYQEYQEWFQQYKEWGKQYYQPKEHPRAVNPYQFFRDKRWILPAR